MAIFTPINSKVAIKRNPPQEDSGAFYLPDSAKEKSQEGVVVAVGPGARLPSGERQTMSVAVGDKVIFAKDSGLDIIVNSEELVVMEENQIISKFA